MSTRIKRQHNWLYTATFDPNNPLITYPYNEAFLPVIARKRLILLLSQRHYPEALTLLMSVIKNFNLKTSAYWRVGAAIVRHLDPEGLGDYLHSALVSSVDVSGTDIFCAWVNQLLSEKRVGEVMEELDLRMDRPVYKKVPELSRIYAMLKYSAWEESRQAMGDMDSDSDNENITSSSSKEKAHRIYSAARKTLFIVEGAAHLIPGDSQLRGAQLELLTYLGYRRKIRETLKHVQEYATIRRDPSQMAIVLHYWPSYAVGSKNWRDAAFQLCSWDPLASPKVALEPLLNSLKQMLLGAGPFTEQKKSVVSMGYKGLDMYITSTKQDSSTMSANTLSSAQKSCYKETIAWVVSVHLILDRLTAGALDHWTLNTALPLFEFYLVMKKHPRYIRNPYMMKTALDQICRRDLQGPLQRLMEKCEQTATPHARQKKETLRRLQDMCSLFEWHHADRDMEENIFSIKEHHAEDKEPLLPFLGSRLRRSADHARKDMDKSRLPRKMVTFIKRKKRAIAAERRFKVALGREMLKRLAVTKSRVYNGSFLSLNGKDTEDPVKTVDLP